jgi:hypothetical protein
MIKVQSLSKYMVMKSNSATPQYMQSAWIRTQERVSSFLGVRFGAGVLVPCDWDPALFAFAGDEPADLVSSFRGFFLIWFVGLAESLLEAWSPLEGCLGVEEDFWGVDPLVDVLGFPSLRGPDDCDCFASLGADLDGVESFDAVVFPTGVAFPDEPDGFCCFSSSAGFSSALGPPAHSGT